ncbi:MAG: alpha/beta hydrolase [Acidimicrobiia bacterium]|nr:alpha/beta hydrolase [Acidimicrobiia bacterium]
MTDVAPAETFRFGDHTLHYEQYGEGDRVVLYLHGLLLSSDINRALARSLAAQGYRVVLLDLLGHGRSDKPPKASAYRMDAYADEVVALLDHLGIDQAVLGGVSLGCNVSLQVAVAAPERVRGMVLEMPVLEWATPAAAMLFTPLLLTMHYAAGPAGALSRLLGRLPATPNDALNGAMALLTASPEVIKSVLHGILIGPVAPTVEQRNAIAAPSLVIAHAHDLIHPFSDAERLAQQLPNGRLEPARSVLELRLFPDRLTAEIAEFLDDLWPVTRVPA